MQASKRYSLARAPKLVEIIAAVPEEHKASLVPLCVLPCCPVSTHVHDRSSCAVHGPGVEPAQSWVLLQAEGQAGADCLRHSRRGGHVQAPQVRPGAGLATHSRRWAGHQTSAAGARTSPRPATSASTARAGQTRTLSTARRATQGTSRPACGPYARATTRTCRPEGGWTSCGGWATQLTRRACPTGPALHHARICCAGRCGRASTPSAEEAQRSVWWPGSP